MVNLLRKIFIKNYKDLANEEVRTKHGYLASFFGIISNLTLVILKIIIGILTLSTSIITDALNNLSDMASSLVNLICFKISNKPADKKHPFGHQRVEYIGSLLISIFILMVAVLLGYNSVLKIISNESTNFNEIAIIILAISIVIKFLQFLFYRKLGKIIKSNSLIAAGKDSLFDIISTTAVLIGATIEFINPSIHLDGIIGLLVALFISIMGIKMIFEAINPLIGEAPDKDFINNIKKDILSYKGVIGIHDFICHNYGPTKFFVTVHVEVDAQTNILISHDLVDTIEQDMEKKYKILITIHMDPIVTNNDEVNRLKELSQICLKTLNNKLSLHDFRIVPGNTHTNVIFDVVIPFECKIKEEEITSKLNEEFNKLNNNYFLKINFDRDFTD